MKLRFVKTNKIEEIDNTVVGVYLKNGWSKDLEPKKEKKKEKETE